MTHTIEFRRSAEKSLLSIPGQYRQNVVAKIEKLETDPLPRNAKKLETSRKARREIWRIRAGDYRVLYLQPDENGVISILAVGHRKEVYRDVNR